MFSKLFNGLKWSKRLLSTIPTQGDGLGFVKSALHKDNIKIASLISGALIVGSGLVLQGGFVSYKVLENAKEMKDLEIKIGEKFEMNTKEMKDLEIKIGEKIEMNAKENAKEMKDLEIKIGEKFEMIAKENAKEMKDLEIKIGEKFEMNAKENAKEMKDLERVIVSQFSNLQTAMISVMASSSNRRPDEIMDALRHEKQNDVTSNSNGDSN